MESQVSNGKMLHVVCINENRKKPEPSSHLGTLMKMNHPSSRMAMAPSGSTSSTKTERKVIEKNRRNQMKTLFSNLNSLFPRRNAKEAPPLPDQIDEAINHIKSLEEKLKKLKVKKESLSARKRPFSECSDSYESASASRAPQLQIKEMGSALEIVLISGLDNQFMFYEIIRILHQEGVDIASASYSVAGNSIVYIVHAEIRESNFSFGAAKVTDRLNRFVNELSSEIEVEPELWDFNDLQPDTWAF
ncbi:DNA binding protein, putative [Ricinus communis]|uniref:DNA binding protein, putative n=1 Tax=Ricinus communis TaxID=3988 RepID=B9RVY4_RICCO|nr:DNA binding protein, putative [Ricinus communis]